MGQVPGGNQGASGRDPGMTDPEQHHTKSAAFPGNRWWTAGESNPDLRRGKPTQKTHETRRRRPRGTQAKWSGQRLI